MDFRHFKFYIQANWIKTLYFNFKLLPFKKAIHCPVLIFGPCTVNIEQTARLELLNGADQFASVLIGNSSSALWGTNIRPDRTYLSVAGLLTFSGQKQFIGNGCYLVVSKGAALFMGDHTSLNNRSKICCQNRIYIDDLAEISWECQLFDTNFHYFVTKDGEVTGRKYGEIRIGKHCWIGYRTTIQKGCCLADNTTVASNSLVNKDFSAEEDIVIAGIPAKLVAKGKSRLKNYALEHKIDDIFLENENVNILHVNYESSQRYYSKEKLDVEFGNSFDYGAK